MITIKKSSIADPRTCDFSKVSKEQLVMSTIEHIQDIIKGTVFFRDEMRKSAVRHDTDKLTDIAGFHHDFITGFKERTWWDNHRKINRHHLLQEDGVPEDVNLIDVLDMINDCVMAGMSRNGSVYPLKISPQVLMTAFNNTIEMLKVEIIVEDNNETSAEIQQK